MYIIKENINKILYHGSPEIIDSIDKKKINYGVFWTTDSKDIALQYAKERYWIKTEYLYLYKIEYDSSVKVADLTDVKSKAFEWARQYYEPTYKYRHNKDLTPEEFVNYADFGLIEGNPSFVKALKLKKFDIVVLNDSNSRQKHVSYGFLNFSKIKNIELIEKIKK